MDSPLIHILIVEDNLAHQRITEYILKKSKTPVKYFVVRDGQEVLDYLYHKDPFADRAQYPRPNLILLDLNLPKRDGREVLGIIKGDATLSEIPIVIVSTSDREEDVKYAFQKGAAAYISKSSGFDRLTEQLSDVVKYAKVGPN